MSKQMKDQIAAADEALLAELGYKQEFHRAFSPLEVSAMIIVAYSFFAYIGSGIRDSI